MVGFGAMLARRAHGEVEALPGSTSTWIFLTPLISAANWLPNVFACPDYEYGLIFCI